jgi:hypothetical protein
MYCVPQLIISGFGGGAESGIEVSVVVEVLGLRSCGTSDSMI